MRKVIPIANFSLYIQPTSASGFVKGSRLLGVRRVIRPVGVTISLTLPRDGTSTALPQTELSITADDEVELQVWMFVCSAPTRVPFH